MLSTREYCNDPYKESLYFSTMDTISHRIALARTGKNMNQSELARALGVSPQAVQSWESGKSQPRGPRLQALAKLLGVSLEYLMSGVTESKETPLKGQDPYGGLFLDSESESDVERQRLSVVTDYAKELEAKVGALNSSLRDTLVNLRAFEKINDPTLLINIFYITAAAAENGLTPDEKEQLAKIVNRIKHQPLGYLEFE